MRNPVCVKRSEEERLEASLTGDGYEGHHKVGNLKGVNQ